MRRLIREERGVAMALVAVSMLALLGMAALVIDVGGLYEERRQLQNGADAAALAIANECTDTGNWPADPDGIAVTYASSNSRDNASAVVAVLLATSDNAGFVQVQLETERTDGANVMAPLFSRVLGDTGTHVTATATAKCGSGGVFPIVISTCETGFLAPLAGKFASFMFHNPHVDSIDDGPVVACHAQPGFDLGEGGSDETLSANFGWLDTEQGKCEAAVDVEHWSLASPGTNTPVGCSEADLSSSISLAVFSTGVKVKTNGAVASRTPADVVNEIIADTGIQSPNGKRFYYIVEIWEFDVSEYRFVGNFHSSDPPCANSETCLSGTFVKRLAPAGVQFVIPGGVARLVPNSDFPG